MWSVGDSVDIESGGIYCAAKIVDVNLGLNLPLNSPCRNVAVHYLGWDNTYDELIPADEFEKKSVPGGTYTRIYKAWAFFSTKYPVWPCMVYLRSPKDGDKDAIKFLKEETMIFVIPYGADQPSMKSCKDGISFDTYVMNQNSYI